MRFGRARIAVVALLVLATAACAQGSRRSAEEKAGGDNSGNSTIVSARDFARSRFDDSTNVTNRWFPLKPGTQLVYVGHAIDDGERLRRRVVFNVTDLTKVVAGVPSVVIWERDYDNGELIESELSFFAQDQGGNVWHLGEYPEEYEDGQFVKAPAWIEGVEGARAGLAMKTEPRLGTPDYAQGFAPAPLYWNDRARVAKIDQRTCVPVDCFEDVLVMEEFERTKPGAFQLKYYAPGVGGVRVGWRGAKEEEKETLALVDRVTLTQAGLAGIRREALALERHAYKISKVYRHTRPAEQV